MLRPVAAIGIVLLLMLPWAAVLAEEGVPAEEAPAVSPEQPRSTSAAAPPAKAAKDQEAPSRGGFAANLNENYGVAGGGLVNTAIGLLIVLALIVAMAFFFKRFGGLPVVRKGAIGIIGGISLGPRERAVLLQVGDTKVLVGVAPGQVRALHVFDREEGAEKADAEAFSRQLDSAVKGAES
jgi:flagellar protein FliO/FliZ